MPAFIDLTGHKYGRLAVLRKTGKQKKGIYYWFCRCDCGNNTVVKSGNLRSGVVKSCGCLPLEMHIKRLTTHGLSIGPDGKHPKLYRVWTQMRQRLTNPNDHNFKYYGARGIKRCSEWDDYEVFHKWAMENGYEEGLSIDRIDPDGDYEPSNCRWVTQLVQQNNRRNSRKRLAALVAAA
jgi:hypothetical protein